MSAVAVADSRIERIVDAFENATIEAVDFDHEAHMLVGWWYLQECSLLDALSRFTGALRRLTRKLGVPSKYHETITWFYMIQIAGRCRGQPDADWPQFKAANADLFAQNPRLIEKYYSASLLWSETARRLFVFPDLRP